jgi:hypothetical protein
MWSPRWNDTDRGKPKDSEKNLSQCHFVHHIFHWIDPGANPGRRGERPATSRLSHNTAKDTDKYTSALQELKKVLLD